MSLGERIKEQRKSSGLSQEKVAEFVGVSRQAVTKWETGQSAPSTENLFKLAEIFGTTVDYKMEQEKKREERRKKIKKNIFFTLVVAVGYVIVYLVGRIFGTTGQQTSVIGWLFGDDPAQLSYLYGWLLHQNIFWIAMAVSVIPALFGKKYFSFTTLAGFALGLLIGELGGQNPAGAAYGYGHYGWAIWGGIFTFSIVMGIIFEKITKSTIDWKSKKLWVWSAVFAIGILSILIIIRMSMPTSFG